MTLETFVSLGTVTMSVAAKGGTWDQIRLLWRHGSVGLSWRRELITWGAYVFWVWHGLLYNLLVEVVAQGLGVVMSGVLLAQVWVDRRTASTASEAAPLVPEGAAP